MKTEKNKKGRNNKKSGFKYEYVFCWEDDQRLGFIACETMNELISLIVAASRDKKTRFNAFTKKEADSIGIKPTVRCNKQGA